MESQRQKGPAGVKVQVWRLREVLREWDVCWLGGFATEVCNRRRDVRLAPCLWTMIALF